MMKHKKPFFRRTDGHNYSRLGVRRKNKQVYRKPRGGENKIRLQMKGHVKKVKIGFKNKKSERGLIKGKKKIMIFNIKDLDKIGKGMIGIIGKIGMKKKIEIAEKVLKDKIEVLNLNAEKFLKMAEEKIKFAKDKESARAGKKVVKDKKVIEKEKEDKKKEEEAKKEGKKEGEKLEDKIDEKIGGENKERNEEKIGGDVESEKEVREEMSKRDEDIRREEVGEKNSSERDYIDEDESDKDKRVESNVKREENSSQDVLNLEDTKKKMRNSPRADLREVTNDKITSRSASSKSVAKQDKQKSKEDEEAKK